MKEFNLHFYSSQNCNVFINGELCGTIDNTEKFFIDVVSLTPSVVVTCEPICTDNQIYVPYSFRLTFVNTLICTNPNVTLVPFPNNNFDLHLNFKTAAINANTTLFNKKVGNYNILAMLDTISTFSIFKNDQNIVTLSKHNLKDFSATLVNSLIVLSANFNNQTSLTLFDTKTETILVDDVFESVEQSETHITTLKNLNTTLGYGVVKKVDLSTHEIETYTVYLSDCVPLESDALIAYNFLESVKAGDFAFAKTFLSQGLSNVSNEKLEQYFGSIIQIYFNCYTFEQNVFNYTIFNNVYKNFNFYLENKKITDIEEVELLKSE